MRLWNCSEGAHSTYQIGLLAVCGRGTKIIPENVYHECKRTAKSGD